MCGVVPEEPHTTAARFLVGLRHRGLARCCASLLSWFYVRNLTQASESNRQRWVGRVANLGEIALPRLFDCLTQTDARVCSNARAALEQMTHSWGEGGASHGRSHSPAGT